MGKTPVYGHEDPHQNWCLLQFSWKFDGFESNYFNALIVIAKIVSTKGLILVLAIALELPIASATRKNFSSSWSYINLHY